MNRLDFEEKYKQFNMDITGDVKNRYRKYYAFNYNRHNNIIVTSDLKSKKQWEICWSLQAEKTADQIKLYNDLLQDIKTGEI